VKRLADESCGATAMEYALIASLISIVIVTATATVGSKVSGMLILVSTSLK
jgi:pilus assembly protein Flp/PilA